MFWTIGALPTSGLLESWGGIRIQFPGSSARKSSADRKAERFDLAPFYVLIEGEYCADLLSALLSASCWTLNVALSAAFDFSAEEPSVNVRGLQAVPMLDTDG
ncbi:uncharacterized protein BO96DRAFT_493747 [Aspergillus niger CBS 101883]|uniref:uncharacterized protein n=1 Tax=Aspergillus lacticoffeatus (strain CBS 101883) TaxID=1450533 RepID=UPI000D7EFBC0|nr:uncharacterized protein BO96DRAFT_493747 [Aspergillus niger CBS 101883]PYH57589.1 hypothetical protein BO96DRAFT_493747 [Aspergillus niger CBS 101883]